MTRKPTKKLTIDITDEQALAAAYPQLVDTIVVTTTVINRQKLRPIVNALHAVGQQVAGVNAYYRSDYAPTPPFDSLETQD